MNKLVAGLVVTACAASIVLPGSASAEATCTPRGVCSNLKDGVQIQHANIGGNCKASGTWGSYWFEVNENQGPKRTCGVFYHFAFARGARLGGWKVVASCFVGEHRKLTVLKSVSSKDISVVTPRIIAKTATHAHERGRQTLDFSVSIRPAHRPDDTNECFIKTVRLNYEKSA